MEKYAAYLSIGDSMSIDTYPFFELSRSNPEVSQNVGAASLLFQNVAEIWPEFDGQDLKTYYPEIVFQCAAVDGATTHDFLNSSYLQSMAPYKDKPVIVTITICGNDLLRMMNSQRDMVEPKDETEQIWHRFEQVVDLVLKELPRAKVVLTTIYDPTDGSGKLPGYPNFTEQLSWFGKTNDYLRDYASKCGFQIADVHKHFLGHGLSAKAEDRWFWAPNPIEPSARGASEIRRLWLEALKH